MSWEGRCRLFLLLLAFIFLTGQVPAADVEDLLLEMSIVPLDSKPAPDFALAGLGGKRSSLKDFRGKVVLLYFWKTTCAICRVELPLLDKLYRELRDQGFVLLAVNIQEPSSVVRKWVRQEGFTFPVLLDRAGAVTGLYRVYGTPTVFLVNRDGQLVGKAIGSRGWTGEKGRSLLNALLADSAKPVDK